MSGSPESFTAYIDESGDEGFTFKDPPLRASSEWFGLGSIMIRESSRLEVMRKMGEAIAPIEKNRNAKIHFSKLPHDARVHLCEQLGKASVRALFVLVNKRGLNDGVPHSLDNTSSRRLYFYLARFLMERISWCARDNSKPGAGNGKCKIVFSKSESISYERMKEYFELLKEKQTAIHWPSIESDLIDVAAHDQSLGCRLADVAISGVSHALERNMYGGYEDRYVKSMKPIIYNLSGNYFSYGLKFFPRKPEQEKTGRYEWLAGFGN